MTPDTRQPEEKLAQVLIGVRNRPLGLPCVATAVVALGCVAASSAGPAAAQALSAPLRACVPVANSTALSVIARTPNIGQMTIFGAPYESAPRTIRVEVDVFGPQSLAYRVDVTVDPRCKVLAETAELISNPWLLGR